MTYTHTPCPDALRALDFDGGLEELRPDEPVRSEQREVLLDGGTHFDGIFRGLRQIQQQQFMQ